MTMSASSDGLTGRLDGVDPIGDGGILRLIGRHERPDDTEPPSYDIRVLVIDAGGQVAAMLESVSTQRFQDGLLRWTGLSADLTVATLPPGRYTLDLELAGPAPHELSRVPVKVSQGVLATSRPVLLHGRRLQVFPVQGSNRAELVIHDAGARGSLVRWRAMSSRRDLGAMVRRRPFAWTRPIRWLTRPLVGGKPIWLVGERPDTARDNGYHVFAYLRRERPDIRAYYVVEPSSDAFERVSALGPVVPHSSWRHRLLMRHATVLLNAYSLKHIVPAQWNKTDYVRHAAWRIGSYRVYLKHGVNEATKTLKRQHSGFDLFLTATEAETRAARETSGYDRQIVLTGLPRFDALVPTPPSRTVLFMPTWRMYLTPPLFSDETEPPVPYEGSTYQRFMDGLLTSPRLLELLERHDHRFELLPHYNMRAHLGAVDLTHDRVTVLDGATSDIQDVMRRCDLFITDHSSVSFDLAYLGTPVIYAHFDDAEYHAGHAHPSWFDHERDGFGPVTYDVESTIDAVEHYLVSGCTREPTYDARAKEAFVFRDRHNSKRAVDAIETLLRTRDGG